MEFYWAGGWINYIGGGMLILLFVGLCFGFVLGWITRELLIGSNVRMYEDEIRYLRLREKRSNKF